MNLKDAILKKIVTDPVGFRNLLEDPQVDDALSCIGILPKILELHAPSEKARKKEGLGQTLCGIRGTRHKIVTCQRCQSILEKS
jgi:hypothetical protein